MRQMPIGAIEMIGQIGAAFATLLPAWTEHEMINDQLTAAVEQIGQCFFAIRALEHVLLVDLDHWQLAPRCAQRISLAREFLFQSQQIFPRHEPFLFRYDFSIQFRFC